MNRPNSTTHSSICFLLFFTFFMTLADIVHAQIELCPIDISGTPCFGKGDPCAYEASGEELCYKFADDNIFFGATLTYTFSQLTSGSINFYDGSFITSGCPSTDVSERRRLRARRRRIRSPRQETANMMNVCAEWDVVWNYGTGINPEYPPSDNESSPWVEPCRVVDEMLHESVP